MQPVVRNEPAKALLEEAVRGRAHEAAFRGLAIEVSGEPRTMVGLDVDLMGRVIDNLLDNALRYTPRGGVVRLGVSPGPIGVRLWLYNSGPSITEADRDRIFEKYERLTGVRGPRGGNRGLGLYFCRLAVEAHKGRISIDDADGTGARFLIDLPA